MKNEKMIVTMTPEEIKENPFIDADGSPRFYRFIAEGFGGFDKMRSIDCCKVNVAKNIEGAWFEYAKENGIEPYQLSMMLLMSGPKALEEIPENCVELEAEALEW